MDYDQVRAWLQLPPGNWPPDHYTLLGLAPGDADPARVEHEVHERLTHLRPLQLQFPDQVTEAMNLLAQAYSCLTDPESKRRYDAMLNSQSAEVGSSAMVQPASPPMETLPRTSDPLAWLFGPWNPNVAEPGSPPPPMRQDWSTAPPPQRAAVGERAPLASQASGSAATQVHHAALTETINEAGKPGPVDPLVKVAHSAPARRGLATKRALYYRIARTRELLWAWERAGRYLNHPRRAMVRSTDAAELTRHLQRIRRLLKRFPPLLGEAGQPGFYVVTLAGQPKPMIIPTFRMLLQVQRETLARDWRDGHKLLVAHRDFLRDELRALRQSRWWSRVLRRLDAAVVEHPGLFWGLTLAIAVGVACVLGFCS